MVSLLYFGSSGLRLRTSTIWVRRCSGIEKPLRGFKRIMGTSAPSAATGHHQLALSLLLGSILALDLVLLSGLGPLRLAQALWLCLLLQPPRLAGRVSLPSHRAILIALRR